MYLKSLKTYKKIVYFWTFSHRNISDDVFHENQGTQHLSAQVKNRPGDRRAACKGLANP